MHDLAQPLLESFGMLDSAKLETSEVHAFLRSRQSIRRFMPDPVSEEVIAQILETAMWAPSAHNRQPWRFVVVTDRTRKDSIARAMGERLRAERRADGDDEAIVEADVSRSRARILEAPVAIFVFMTQEHMDHYPDARRQTAEQTMAMQSTAMATQNLLLAVHAEGLGACIMCAPLFCATAVGEALGAPPTWQAQSLVLLGRPAAVRERKGRLPLASVVVTDPLSFR